MTAGLDGEELEGPEQGPNKEPEGWAGEAELTSESGRRPRLTPEIPSNR